MSKHLINDHIKFWRGKQTIRWNVTTLCTWVVVYSAWGPFSNSGKKAFVPVTLHHTDWLDIRWIRQGLKYQAIACSQHHVKETWKSAYPDLSCKDGENCLLNLFSWSGSRGTTRSEFWKKMRYREIFLFIQSISTSLRFLHNHAVLLLIETTVPVVGFYISWTHDQRSVWQHDIRPRVDLALLRKFDGAYWPRSEVVNGTILGVIISGSSAVLDWYKSAHNGICKRPLGI